jgi:hypothetical protein
LSGTWDLNLDCFAIARSDVAAAEVNFVRARRADRRGRLVTLIQFPRSELLADGERLREVERYLG